MRDVKVLCAYDSAVKTSVGVRYMYNTAI